MRLVLIFVVFTLPISLGMFLAFASWLRDAMDALSDDGRKHGIW